MELITSMKNPRVLAWRELKDNKGRRQSGLFLVEGRKMTEEALRSGFTVDTILVDADRVQEFDLPVDIPVCALPSHVFASVCDTKTPQGIAAVVRIQQGELSRGRIVVMDGVQDPGNVGTIIRTADCAGFTGVIVTDKCADVFSPKVLRSTMGSIFRMPILQTNDLPLLLAGLKRDWSCSVISSQLDGTPFYQRTGVDADNLCLIIGNEGNGVSDAVQAQATHRLKLPMRGGAESLNAAIAAGIMMYELTRQID